MKRVAELQSPIEFHNNGRYISWDQKMALADDLRHLGAAIVLADLI